MSKKQKPPRSRILCGGKEKSREWLEGIREKGLIREKACMPPKPKEVRTLLPGEENQMLLEFMGE